MQLEVGYLLVNTKQRWAGSWRGKGPFRVPPSHAHRPPSQRPWPEQPPSHVDWRQPAPVQPRAQRQCASPDASTRQRPLEGAPQWPGHCTCSHCCPDHPAAHTHTPRSQRPCSPQPGSHTSSEQSGPRWNGWHTQTPASQRPRPEHRLGHSAGAAAAAPESSCMTPRGRCVGSAGGGGDGASETEQPAPANPGWHEHTPDWHTPCPEQCRGHASFSQASPAQPC